MASGLGGVVLPMPDPAEDLLDDGEAEEATETEAPAAPTLRQRLRGLVWREPDAQRVYVSGSHHIVPRGGLPFGWGVVYTGTVPGRHVIAIAPFPLNLLFQLVRWLRVRLFLAPLISTSYGEAMIEARLQERLEAAEEMWQERSDELNTIVRRGRAAEVLLRREQYRLAALGEGPCMDYVDQSSWYYEAEEDSNWTVEESESDSDCFRFMLNVKTATKPAPMSEIDMTALRVGGAYVKTEHDEF